MRAASWNEAGTVTTMLPERLLPRFVLHGLPQLLQDAAGHLVGRVVLVGAGVRVEGLAAEAHLELGRVEDLPAAQQAAASGLPRALAHPPVAGLDLGHDRGEVRALDDAARGVLADREDA